MNPSSNPNQEPAESAEGGVGAPTDAELFAFEQEAEGEGEEAVEGEGEGEEEEEEFDKALLGVEALLAKG